MEYIPYLMELGKILGWPAVVVATILIFVIRDLNHRVAILEANKKVLEEKLAAENKTLETTIIKRLDDTFSKIMARVEKLESADTSIKNEFKDELSKIYEKINAMSENIAVLKDRSDRKEKKEASED